MIQIVRITFNDDKDASTSVDVMVCSSIDAAKEIILGEINKGFDGKWKSLPEAAKELNKDLTNCTWNEDEKDFMWFDNGKGENYMIGRINERAVNTKFQRIN